MTPKCCRPKSVDVMSHLLPCAGRCVDGMSGATSYNTCTCVIAGGSDQSQNTGQLWESGLTDSRVSLP